ncbi:MAG: hypothetical protein B7Z40_20935 [Bosea sp. 12-68-7]|nr:MAG: hypothetical protein B7Z40_20935 [Bosea sp. 12-68-7]
MSGIIPDYIVEFRTGRTTPLHTFQGGDFDGFYSHAQQKALANLGSAAAARAGGMPDAEIRRRMIAAIKKADVVVLFYPPHSDDEHGFMIAKGRKALKRYGKMAVFQAFDLESREDAVAIRKAYGDKVRFR